MQNYEAMNMSTWTRVRNKSQPRVSSDPDPACGSRHAGVTVDAGELAEEEEAGRSRGRAGRRRRPAWPGGGARPTQWQSG